MVIGLFGSWKRRTLKKPAFWRRDRDLVYIYHFCILDTHIRVDDIFAVLQNLTLLGDASVKTVQRAPGLVELGNKGLVLQLWVSEPNDIKSRLISLRPTPYVLSPALRPLRLIASLTRLMFFPLIV